MAPAPIVFALLSGWEVFAILAIVLVLFGARSAPPDFWRGLKRGASEFRRSSDELGFGAGKSIGGIFGKPAAEAITAKNEVAELYDPGAFRNKSRQHLERIKNWLLSLRPWIWRAIRLR